MLNVAKSEGRVDAKGKVLEDDKPKPDPIDKSIAVRMKVGTYLSVDKSVAKKDEPAPFKLRLKGAITLKEIKKDVSLG